MQNIELKITTVMYAEHVRCDDNLETQNTVSIMTTMMSIMPMLCLGVGK